MVAKGRAEGWHIIFLKKFSTSQSRSRTEEPVPLGGEDNCQASFCKRLSFCPKQPQPSLLPLLALHQWDWVMWNRRTTMVRQKVNLKEIMYKLGESLCHPPPLWENWESSCIFFSFIHFHAKILIFGEATQNSAKIRTQNTKTLGNNKGLGIKSTA